jgi:hypothetical protein
VDPQHARQRIAAILRDIDLRSLFQNWLRLLRQHRRSKLLDLLLHNLGRLHGILPMGPPLAAAKIRTVRIQKIRISHWPAA